MTYNIYANGTSTYKNGTFISNDGKDGLEDYIGSKEVVEKDVVETIIFNNVTYTVYKNGTVINKSGKIISTDPDANVQDVIIPTTYVIDEQKYFVYKDNRSTYTNGTVILKEGGYPAL